MTVLTMSSGGFGPILSALLKELDVSNEELARRLRIDGSSVRKWRRGEVDPKWSTLQEIARVLKVDPVRLLRPAEPAGAPGSRAGSAGVWVPVPVGSRRRTDRAPLTSG